MESPSEFQKLHPLSPRKFWKKMLGVLTSVFFMSIMFAVGGGSIAIILSLRPNTVFPVWKMVLICTAIFFLVFFAMYIVYGLYIQVYIARYYYDIKEHFITIKKGVFAPTEIHVQYQKIQDVYVDQDIVDRLLGIYDVHIASATVSSGIEAHIDGVSKDTAERIKNLLLGHITGGNFSSGESAPVAQPQKTDTRTVHFDSPISSEHFPIQGAWLVVSIIVSFFRMILAYVLFVLYILGKSSRSRSAFEGVSSFAFVGALVLFGIFLCGFILRAVWILLWRKTFYFEFQPYFILLRDGVISREEKHVRYGTIQNVTVKQSIIDRIFGFGTVVIENAANSGSATSASSKVTLPGQRIENAQKIVEMLNAELAKRGELSTGV